MKLILASNNKAKLREFRRMFEGTEVELVSQREAGYDIEVEENGTSFEENSYIKAKAITDLSGCAAIADDSGIEVDCLGGEPGIYSARYGVGHEASDEERNNYMLAKMGDSQDRTARYVCAVCCTLPNGDVIRTRGECEGDILFSPRGQGGFGYDPLFVPKGFERTIAEISAEEKDAISHRGKATREFVEKFKEYLNGNNK